MYVVSINCPFTLFKEKLELQIDQMVDRPDSAIVVGDFNTIKVFSPKDFLSHSRYLITDFVHHKPAFFIAEERNGNISYGLGANGKEYHFIPQFLHPEYADQWNAELTLSHKVEEANNEIEFIQALDEAPLASFVRKGNHFGFCRPHNVNMFYFRCKTSHVLSDIGDVRPGGGYKQIYLNTSPTLVDLETFTLYKIEN